MGVRFQTLIHETELPTSDLYFSHSMAPYIGVWDDPDKPIAAISPNAFFARGANDNFLVVCRKVSKAVQEARAKLPAHKLVYVLDDDLGAALADTSLPIDYRARLWRAHRQAKKLLPEAEHVVVSSNRLADLVDVASERLHRLDPALIGPVAKLDHFETGSQINMVYTGTRSHLADFQFIFPGIRQVLDSFDNVSLTTFFGTHLKPRHHHPKLINNAPLNWPAFRQYLLDHRFHIALVVGRNRRFNNSRSFNKLLECALLGAAPVMSGAVPFAGIAKQFPEQPFDSDDPCAPAIILSRLIDDHNRCRQLARSNVKFVENLQSVETQRNFWRRLLGTGSDLVPL